MLCVAYLYYIKKYKFHAYILAYVPYEPKPFHDADNYCLSF